MTSGQPQGDIIIDPTYHRTPYFRQITQSQHTEKVPTFYVYRYSDQRQGPLNNNACAQKVGRWPCWCLCDLMEVGKPMMKRVNNDVALG